MSLPDASVERGEPSTSKVQIPRLPQKRNESPKRAPVNKFDRVSRACLSCRSRKVKCNGELPQCSNCRTKAASCVYATSRRDRLKTATTHNQDMVALLRELRTQVAVEEQHKIDTLLASAVDDVTDAAATVQRSPEKLLEADEGEEPGEANVSAEVGSNEEQDLVDEDLMQDEQTRATGFIGKASEIQWLRRLHQTDGRKSDEGPYGPPGSDQDAATERLAALRRRQDDNPLMLMHTSKASYYLDDELLETDFMTEPTEMPPFKTAERLLMIYMSSCHNSFPFLAKRSFLNEFYHYYAAIARGNPYDPPHKWQATLNLVFAIGAVYSHLVSAEWQAEERDHLVYYSRASALGLRDPWWFSHPDLPQMQITGLTSFYYMTIGRVNRAWVLIGLAMRFAYALGLHMRNEDPGASMAKKEVLGRIWWAHFAFERLLSATIGRPSQGIDRTASVPLPLPISSRDIDSAIIESRFGDQLKRSTGVLPRNQGAAAEGPTSSSQTDSSFYSGDTTNSGTYQRNMIQLCQIMQDALYLYTSGTGSLSWQSVQKLIASLNEELDIWAVSLSDGLNFFNNGLGHQYKRERNSLEILYHNTKILINRPCLCRLNRRIVNQTASSNDFNEKAATICVASAKAIADLLSDDPEKNVTEMYGSGSWWNMVHTIMQSLVVLLLEFSLRGNKFPTDSEEIIPSLKKLIRWLRAMRTKNGVARRAYTIGFDLLKKLVTTIELDISDLVGEDEASNYATVVTPPLEARDMRTYPDSPIQQMVPEQYTQQEFTSPFQFHHGDTVYNAQAGPSATEFMQYSAEMRDTSQETFPGLLYTTFDEQTPLLGLGGDAYQQGYQENLQRWGHGGH